jgi:hypothetical protein
MAIHVAWDAALHVHSRATPIAIEPVPPDGVNAVEGAVTIAWHLPADVGLVTLETVVDVELPHAIAPSAIAIAVASE